jgi:hypothetical protein
VLRPDRFQPEARGQAGFVSLSHRPTRAASNNTAAYSTSPVSRLWDAWTSQSGGQASDARVFQPRIGQGVGPSHRVPGRTQTPVDGSAGAVSLIVAADVVTEQVVGKKDIATPAMDLRGFGELYIGIAAGGCECTCSVGGKEVAVAHVCAGPDPQVATIVRRLVSEEQPGEKGKGAGGLLAGRVPVDVGPAGPMRAGGNVQRHLGLVERNLEPVVSHQLSGDRKNPTVGAEEVEQSRGLARGPPVKVVAYMAWWWGRIRHQPVDLSVQRIERVGPHQTRDHDPTCHGKGADLVDGQHVRQTY